jgi:hypothetical protein
LCVVGLWPGSPLRLAPLFVLAGWKETIPAAGLAPPTIMAAANEAPAGGGAFARTERGGSLFYFYFIFWFVPTDAEEREKLLGRRPSGYVQEK